MVIIVHKKAILTLVSISLFVALVSFARAQVGLGIWPAKFDADVPFLGRYNTLIYLFNPSNRDADVVIGFSCKSCSEDFDFLGIKGQKILYLDYSISPEKMTVEKDTQPNASKSFTFSLSNPLFLRQELVFSNFRIPYWSLNIGKRAVDGEIQATLTNSMTSLTITSRAEITFEGISPLFLLFFVSIAVFSITLWIHQRQRKLRM